MKSAKNLSDLFSNKLGNWKKFSLKNLRKDQLLILLLTGILLMVIAVPAGKKKENMSSASNDNTEKSVNGTSAGTFSKTSKKENTVYRTDSESNSQGSGSPYVSKELSPKIEGVVVIADGGENAVVKENISSAVQALFDIEPHKIRIMKKQTN